MIRPIRRFEGTEAEWGFIKVHIAMEQHSGELCEQVVNIFDAAKAQNRVK